MCRVYKSNYKSKGYEKDVINCYGGSNVDAVQQRVMMSSILV